MSEIFEAKLRSIGNSLGVIIPTEIIETLGCHRGDLIQMVIPSSDVKARNNKIRELAGSYRDKSGFHREKGDRY